MNPSYDNDRALNHLLDLLAIEGLSGQERKIAEAITEKLLTAGCEKDWIKTDNAHKQLGENFETGNLIVRLPGRVNAPRILFSAHMDTVPLCRSAVPIIRENRIEAKGNSGLGGDDRSGCAAMIVLAETLLQQDIVYPPITLLFAIAEENGLNGSRMVRLQDLGDPVMGFNLDGRNPEEIVVGAMSAIRWTAKITGISSHAGLDPHKGISAGLIGSKAMAYLAERGWFGKIVRGRRKGTANLGFVHGGEANNQVMDRCIMNGECRSHSSAFLEKIVEAYRKAFKEAASSVTNDEGKCGAVSFTTTSDYRAFRLKTSELCVKISCKAVKLAGGKPKPLVMDAGLDANNLNEKGLPTVTLGTGSHRFHQVEEYVDIQEYFTGCGILLHIARLAGSG